LYGDHCIKVYYQGHHCCTPRKPYHPQNQSKDRSFNFWQPDRIAPGPLGLVAVMIKFLSYQLRYTGYKTFLYDNGLLEQTKNALLIHSITDLFPVIKSVLWKWAIHVKYAKVELVM
jgi:hypothetical protein